MCVPDRNIQNSNQLYKVHRHTFHAPFCNYNVFCVYEMCRVFINSWVEEAVLRHRKKGSCLSDLKLQPHHSQSPLNVFCFFPLLYMFYIVFAIVVIIWETRPCATFDSSSSASLHRKGKRPRFGLQTWTLPNLWACRPPPPSAPLTTSPWTPTPWHKSGDSLGGGLR